MRVMQNPPDDDDGRTGDGGGEPGVDSGGGEREQPGLRERKKRATARALHETAVDMVAGHGLDDVTVEAICDAVGVSTRTFFNYFSSKEDALTASLPMPPTDHDLANFEAGGPTGRLIADLGEMVATHMVRHTTSVANVAAHHRMLHREQQLVGRWRAALHAIEQRFTTAIATREGHEPTHIGVVMLGAMTSAGIRTAMQRWVAGDGAPDIDVHVRAVFALLDASINPEALLGDPDACPSTSSSTTAPTSTIGNDHV